MNLGGGGIGWQRRVIAVGVGDVDLFEGKAAAALERQALVRHLVDGDGVGQLADEVQERLGLGLEEDDVARSAAGGGDQRRHGQELQTVLVDAIYAD